ncbi:hypothetical protein GF324_06045, partial [bacterium]|nr:hypothetical protein [bacterium]
MHSFQRAVFTLLLPVLAFAPSARAAWQSLNGPHGASVFQILSSPVDDKGYVNTYLS